MKRLGPGLLLAFLLALPPAWALEAPARTIDYQWKEKVLSVARFDERTVLTLPERPLAFEAEVACRASVEEKWPSDRPAFFRLSVLDAAGEVRQEFSLRPGDGRRETIRLAPGERLRIELYAGQYSFLFIKSGAEVNCRLQWPELRFAAEEVRRRYAFSFAVAGLAQVERWVWDFGDGAQARGAAVEHLYRGPGSYRLSVIGYCGAEAVQRYQRNMAVPEFVELAPEVGPLEGPAELAVSCRSGLLSHYGEGAECIWDFGDGSPPVAGDRVDHLYRTPGRFPLAMIIRTAEGSQISQRTWYVVVRPIAIQNRGQVTPLEGIIPLKIECTAQPRVDGSPVDLLCRWDFGDGNYAEGFKATHVFGEAGYHQVTLDLTDRRHPEIAIPPAVFRVRALPPAVSVRPVANPTRGRVPLTVLFVPNLAVKGYPVELRYRWEFGDGAVSDEAAPLHTYVQPGDFTVRLTVKDLRHGTEARGTLRIEAAAE